MNVLTSCIIGFTFTKSVNIKSSYFLKMLQMKTPLQGHRPSYLLLPLTEQALLIPFEVAAGAAAEAAAGVTAGG